MSLIAIGCVLTLMVLLIYNSIINSSDRNKLYKICFTIYIYIYAGVPWLYTMLFFLKKIIFLLIMCVLCFSDSRDVCTHGLCRLRDQDKESS